MNQIFGGIECKLYICHVIFFIVLDLRLTKVGARRCSFLFLVPSVSFHSPNHQLLNAVDFLKYSVSCFHPMDFMLSLCQCKLTNNLPSNPQLSSSASFLRLNVLSSLN